MHVMYAEPQSHALSSKKKGSEHVWLAMLTLASSHYNHSAHHTPVLVQVLTIRISSNFADFSFFTVVCSAQHLLSVTRCHLSSANFFSQPH